MAREYRPVGTVVRITRALLVLQLFAAILFALLIAKLFNLPSTWLAIPAGFAVVLLVRLLITANNFYLSSRFRDVTVDRHRLSFPQRCKLFLEEFRSTMMASSLTMPFHPFRQWMASDSSSPPVLLIHGYGCNSGFWHKMSKALARNNITHYAVDLEPVLGGIDEYGSTVYDAIERIRQETGVAKIVIVAHSMGGLVVRAYMRKHGCSSVAGIITLGTPHHGTGVAHFGAGLNCQQMQWSPDAGPGISSNWLRELAKDETDEIYKLVISIYSRHDNIVSPHVSSILPGAINIEFVGVGHVALGFNPEVQARVIAEIQKISAQVPKNTASTAEHA
jgi:triacylglycerol lipase